MTIARMAIQAPARNLVTSTMTRTTRGEREPDGVDHPRPLHAPADRRVPLGDQVPGPVPDHPELAQVERHEDADDVELDQPGDLGVEGEDQDDRHHREEHDAVAVGQPVAPGAEGARREAVLRQDRAQHREAVERCVRGQHQDDAGHRDHEVEAGVEVDEHRAGDLRDHRVLVVVGRDRGAIGADQPVELVRVDVAQPHLAGQHDDAEHHRDRDHREQQQRGRGVLATWACGTPGRRWRSPRHRSARHSRTRTPGPAAGSAPIVVSSAS